MKKFLKSIHQKLSDLIKNKNQESVKNLDILKANDNELDSALRALLNTEDETVGFKELIKATIISNIRNDKHSSHMQFLGVFIGIITVGLIILNLILTKQQTNYAEIQSRRERIIQTQDEERAIERCKYEPNLKESGLIYVDTGKAIPCSDLLKISK